VLECLNDIAERFSLSTRVRQLQKVRRNLILGKRFKLWLVLKKSKLVGAKKPATGGDKDF